MKKNSRDGTRAKILTLRQAIREHRDTKGDDRCWLDDYLVWKHTPSSPEDVTALPAYKEGMRECRAFYQHRNADTPDPTPPDAITDPARWDADLERISDKALQAEYDKLEQAIRAHRDITGRERTADDDRSLYSVLPEKMPADLRLPPEDQFLGTATEGVGCPNFWKSHQNCKTRCHNLHEWGPCEPDSET